MRHDPILQLLLTEAFERVRRTANLEGADALEVLALEEEVDARLGGGAAFEGGADERGGGLGRRGEVVERLAGKDGRFVDVGLDEFVGGLDRGAGQGRAGGYVGHCGGLWECPVGS